VDGFLVARRGQAKKDVVFNYIFNIARRLSCDNCHEADKTDGMAGAYGYWSGRWVLSVRDQEG
jgi:hypothetical protein